MSKWIVDIHGDIEGDYDLIAKYTEPQAGHWKRNETIRLTYCSVCGFGQHKDESRTYRYCPNCGAKMEDKE